MELLYKLYFLLPILMFVLNLIAVWPAMYLKSPNALLTLIFSVFLGLICAFTSPLSSSLVFKFLAPFLLALSPLLATLPLRSAAAASAAALAFAGALAYAALHSAGLQLALSELAFWPLFAAAALFVALFAPHRGFNFALLAAGCWQYFTPAVFSFSGAAAVVVFITYARVSGKKLPIKIKFRRG